MKLLARIFGSSIGKKYLMAITGLGLFGFVVGHMVGNLQFLLGPEAINRYAAFLQSTGELLWVVRLGLLALLTLHIWSAVQLTLENRSARPQRYEERKPLWASYASRTMIWSGAIIAVFIVYHLLHYTVRVEAINLTGEDFNAYHEMLKNGEHRHDVFKMMVTGFSHPAVSLFYAAGVGLLCFHLSHGVSAMFQSLGLGSKTWESAIKGFALVTAWGLFLGYMSIPVAVMFGFGKEVLK